MISRQPPENRLLLLLGGGGMRAELQPLVPVDLSAREVLQQPGMPALYAYFPVTAVVSLMSTMESGASTEVALVGREGAIGLGDALGAVESPTSASVQVSGTALRMPAEALKAARRAHRAIGRVLDLYTEARLIQVAQTAACNRLHTVDARLARWLLAMHDRVEADEFVVAQECIAEVLGVHRPTVSAAIQRFHEQRALARRGRAIVIADRWKLESLACECHRVLEATFERVFGRGADVEELWRGRPASPAHEADPDMPASLVAMRDIAGRLLVATIREQEAREAAEEANRSKDQFLAMVSHELRAPLNAILGWCGILKANEQARERGLSIIERNARAQPKLVGDLLDAARVTSATLTIDPRPVSLAELVGGAVDTIQPAADDKAVRLHVSAADEALPPLVGDADRLRQVLLNVLTNSLKFTGSGGSIDVQVGSRAGRARVTVHDSGRGISRALLPQVFDRFRRGSARDPSHQGLGLGLAISRAIVELHGGTIEIDSPGENQGTTCTIELPLASGQQESTAGPSRVTA
jgi:signal transduction histidine kinase